MNVWLITLILYADLIKSFHLDIEIKRMLFLPGNADYYFLALLRE